VRTRGEILRLNWTDHIKISETISFCKTNSLHARNIAVTSAVFKSVSFFGSLREEPWRPAQVCCVIYCPWPEVIRHDWLGRFFRNKNFSCSYIFIGLDKYIKSTTICNRLQSAIAEVFYKHNYNVRMNDPHSSRWISNMKLNKREKSFLWHISAYLSSLLSNLCNLKSQSTTLKDLHQIYILTSIYLPAYILSHRFLHVYIL